MATLTDDFLLSPSGISILRKMSFLLKAKVWYVLLIDRVVLHLWISCLSWKETLPATPATYASNFSEPPTFKPYSSLLLFPILKYFPMIKRRGKRTRHSDYLQQYDDLFVDIEDQGNVLWAAESSQTPTAIHHLSCGRSTGMNLHSWLNVVAYSVLLGLKLVFNTSLWIMGNWRIKSFCWKHQGEETT